MMRQKITLLMFLLSLVMLLPLLGMAQERTITGTVRSSNGNVPLERVSITVVGTTKNTLTDANGNFSITASPKQVLQFTYVGFTTYEVTVGNSTNLEITLTTRD